MKPSVSGSSSASVIVWTLSGVALASCGGGGGGRPVVTGLDTTEGGTYSFKANDFGFDSANVPVPVTIVSVPDPEHGRLELNGNRVNDGETIPAASVETLKFVPAQAASTYQAEFSYRVSGDSQSRSFSITVMANDDFATAIKLIQITPSISENTNISGNGVAIGTIVITDDDRGNFGTLELVRDDDHASFELTNGEGIWELRLKEGLSFDHETVAVLSVRIHLREDPKVVTDLIIVNVNNINDNTPSATASGVAGLDEGEYTDGTAVGTLTFIPSDGDGDDVIFEVGDSRFRVDSINGIDTLVVNGTQTFGPGTVTFDVTPKDNGPSPGNPLTGTPVSVAVTITDAPDAPSVSFIGGGITAQGSVTENAAPALIPGIRFTASDRDAAQGEFIASDFTIEGGGASLFEVVAAPASGEFGIRQKSVFDYENSDHQGPFTLTVRVKDDADLFSAPSGEITVTVVNINDNDPTAMRDGAQVTLNEGEIPAGTETGYRIDGSDADGDAVSFIVSDGRFEVVGRNLRLKDTATFTPGQITFNITPMDDGSPQRAGEPLVVSINIGDVADAPTVSFIGGGVTAQGSVTENAPPALIPGITFTANDRDAAQGEFVASDFTIEGGGATLFEIAALATPRHFGIRPKASLDFENPGEDGPFTLTVKVKDDMDLFSAPSGNITITVVNVNENDPEATRSGTQVTLTAGQITAATATGYLIDGSDADGDTVSFTVDDNRFEVVGGSLRIKDTATFAPGVITLMVTPTDDGNPPRTGAPISVSLTISVNDPPTVRTSSQSLNGIISLNDPDDLPGALTLYGVTEPSPGEAAYNVISVDAGETETVKGVYGSYSITRHASDGTATWAYVVDHTEPKTMVLPKGATAQDRLEVIVYDDGDLYSNTVTITVDITGVNNRPVLRPLPGGIITDIATSGSSAFTGVQRGSFNVLDDRGDIHTFAAVGATTPDTGSHFTVDGLTFTHRVEGTYGELYLNAAGNNAGSYYYKWDEAEVGKLSAGDTEEDIFVVTARDNSGINKPGSDDHFESEPKNLIFTINGVRDGLATALALDQGADTSVAENEDTAAGIRIGRINITDPDGGSFGMLELTGDDAGLFDFETDSTTVDIWLRLSPGVFLNHETEPMLTVRVQLEEDFTVRTTPITVTVTDANHRPSIGVEAGTPSSTRPVQPDAKGDFIAANITDIAGDMTAATGSTVDFGTLVGRLTQADDDTADTHTFGAESAMTPDTGTHFTAGGHNYTHRVEGTYGDLYFNTAGTDGSYAYIRDEAEIEKLDASTSQSDIFTISVTDSSGDAASAQSAPQKLVFIINGISPEPAIASPTGSTTVSVDEDGLLEFSQAGGENAISVSGTGDLRIPEVVISVTSGTLSTGHQLADADSGTDGRGYRIRSEADTETGTHALTFTHIDAHDLNALLEGLLYLPDADYNGEDMLTIRIEAGGRTTTEEISITVDPVDDPLQIVNFGGRTIYRDNVDKFKFAYTITLQEYDRLIPADRRPGRLPPKAGDEIHVIEKLGDIEPYDLTPNDNVEIVDPDGYTVAGGTLYFRVVEQFRRNSPDEGYFDPDHEYIKIREALNAGETGVYLDGTTVKYRSDASQPADDDISVATVNKIPRNADRSRIGEKGDHLVEYMIAFNQRPESSLLTDDQWEVLLKESLVDLLNSTDADLTPNLEQHILRLDYNTVNTRLIDQNYKTVVTAYFEDGASGQVSDQEGVLVTSDQRLNGSYSSYTAKLVNGNMVEIEYTLNSHRGGNPVVGNGPIIKSGDITVVNARQVWNVGNTISTLDNNDPDGPLVITYSFADSQADLDRVTAVYGRPDRIDVLQLQADNDIIRDVFDSIEDVINMKFIEERELNISTSDLVFSSIKVQPGTITLLGVAQSFDDYFGRPISHITSLSLTEPGWSYERVREVYLHEILHGLGLSHPGLQQGNEGPPLATSDMAVFENSVMAYVSGLDFGENEQRFPIMPQLHDIESLQRVYGVNTTTRSVDTVYDYTDSIQAYEIIYDMGGVDLFNFNNPDFKAGVDLEMTAGARSKIATTDHNWNFVIAYNVVIENVIGTKHADIIRGNDADNILEGLAGADILDGRFGSDTASYSLSEAGVSVDLTRAGGIQATTNVSGDHSSGDTLTSIENLIGSPHDDALTGNRDHNRLEGGGGDDTYTGGGGRDVFVAQFGTGKGLDTITDFEIGVDTLILEVAGALADFFAVFASMLTATKPDSDEIELRMTGNSTDGLDIQFTEAIAAASITDAHSLKAALGGEDHIQIDVV
ncbi:MAG: VCBS domain-containing protein [Parvularculales bacterium]